jgi:hypothetical protein
MKLIALTAVVICLLLCSVSPALAQSATGQITGTVRDATGAVIINAPVTVNSQLTGQTRTTTTNDSGSYSFPLLPVSVYTIKVDQTGFRAATRSDIQLNVDQVVRVDIDLQVGEVSETVDVKATAVETDTENAAVGQVVSQKQVNDLPLNGRNFLSLLFLGNGAVTINGEQGGMRQGVGDAISINGARPTSNNYLLDGTTNTDTSLNTPAVVLSVDAIQEFKEQTANYSAEYGFSANQINLISKSGTNDLHGALFWFDRNDAFDARRFFDAGIPVLRQNQYGFVVGGPVYLPKIYNGRNKTFWLVNWDATKIRRGAQFFGVVPSPDQLAGRFSTTIIDPVTGAPFPNNTIPSERFARLSKVALENHFWPAANINLPQGNYRANIPQPLDTHQETYRMDQFMGKFGTVFARGTITRYTNTAANNITTLADTFFIEDSTNWQVTHTINIGPHVVNQFRLGFLEATANQSGVPAPQSAVDAIALTGVFQKMPDIQRTWPLLSMTGYSSGGGAVNAYQASNQPMWDYSDSLNIIRGKHTFTVGANYRRWRLNRDLANNFLGVFGYTGLATGDPVADMLLGYYQSWQNFQPGAFSIGIGNPRQFNFQYFAPYFQDDWKVSPRLTLNLGIRWDFRTVPYETHNHMGWNDVTNKLGGMCIADQTLVTKGVAPDGNGFYRYCGRRNPVDSPLTPFAPRFGFAYRPFGGDKTVVRGGYGIFWDSAEGREIDGSADIYPYVSRGIGFQSLGQKTPFQTTDVLFPSFSAPAPVTPASDSFLAVNISEFPRNPYVQQWSLSIQRQLGSNTKLEVSYIGNKGTHLLMRRNFAQALVPTEPFDHAHPPSVASRKPYPNFNVFINSDWSGISSYHSGNMKLEHRAGRLLFTTAYTWAKSIDNKSAAAGIGGADTGWQGFIDNHNAKLEHARSDFDVDHRLVSSFVYNLPFGRGGKYLSSVSRAADLVVGGWQLNGIVTFQRGFPYSIYAQDKGGVLDDFDNRAHLIGNPNSGSHTIAQWFNTAAFSQPDAGVIGTSGRNILRGPGINNWDMSVFKNFEIREQVRLQMRLESFNAFNHTQWGGPHHNTADKQFGQITSTRDARINQVGLKLVF